VGEGANRVTTGDDMAAFLRDDGVRAARKERRRRDSIGDFAA
jgi:hypothetical protein